MSNTMQDFFVTATQKAAEDMVAAFLTIPEEKQDWAPEGGARSALDMVAECAILNGYTADLIRNRKWPSGGYDAYMREKAALSAQGWDNLHTHLKAETEKAIAVIQTVPEEDLKVDIDMPWGKQTVADIIAYPYWNMTYHLGQINYIASVLGCLK